MPLHDIHGILKNVFGYHAFRGVQQQVIEAILAGKDALALLPTGGGKSICYQIPALANEGICLVVTPLIALMKDQARQLQSRNIPVLVMHSGMPFYEVKKTLQNATSHAFKFLFVSPERLQTNLFKEYLPAIPVNLIAVDEAHCISQWGYDFRPPYLTIADIREAKPDIPVLALTASATEEVQKDIMQKLAFRRPLLFRQTFARNNLSFSSYNLPDKTPQLLRVLHNVNGSALVYCRNRRLTREMAEWLQANGLRASFYHAGLSSNERNSRQDAWTQNQVQVMVCTNAFGMGIDKADVRTVVHIDMPESLEYYYQEAGRAGRDDKRAYAVLIFNTSDTERLEKIVDEKFPPLDIVRKLYDDVCNYLSIPIGAGESQYYIFDIETFCDRFKQTPGLTLNALRILQQSGCVSFSDNIHLRSRVGFVCDKDDLYRFEQDQPQLEPLIKSLLRTYEGIFTNEVSISEKQLAKLLQKDETAVALQLKQLDAMRIIDYQPKSDEPQVYFHYNRVPGSQLVFDHQMLRRQKNLWQQRVSSMLQYARDTQTCRSNIIRRYFGDTEADNCGICDNCLRKKSAGLQKQFHEKTKALLYRLNEENNPERLRRYLKVSHNDFDAMIDYLLGEERILVDINGLISKA